LESDHDAFGRRDIYTSNSGHDLFSVSGGSNRPVFLPPVGAHMPMRKNDAPLRPKGRHHPMEYRRADHSPAYLNLLGQITYLTKLKGHDLHVYLGVENLLNYKQELPLVASDDPFGNYFDASMVWGPIYGRMIYAGLRFRVKK
jgi:hypothetical protein